MQARILLIGDDPALLLTRALLLAKWNPVTVTTHESMSVLYSQEFDIVILGQLVSHGMVTELICAAKAKHPATDILLIRFPEDQVDFGVETHSADLRQSPGWLRERVAVLIARRIVNKSPLPLASFPKSGF
jgi:hypothetical protein